jgi:hypothetical protein
MAVGNLATVGILKASPSILSTDPRAAPLHVGPSQSAIGIASLLAGAIVGCTLRLLPLIAPTLASLLRCMQGQQNGGQMSLRVSPTTSVGFVPPDFTVSCRDLCSFGGGGGGGSL